MSMESTRYRIWKFFGLLTAIGLILVVVLGYEMLSGFSPETLALGGGLLIGGALCGLPALLVGVIGLVYLMRRREQQVTHSQIAPSPSVVVVAPGQLPYQQSTTRPEAVLEWDPHARRHYTMIGDGE